jgi:protein involved in sex pheromone biosynthesis
MAAAITRRNTLNKAVSKSQAEKTKPITFHTKILQAEKNATGIQVPEEIIEKLVSGKRPLVRVTIKKYTYRSAVAVMDGKFMISLSAENRQAAGVQGGEEVDVTLELDLEPRTVELPKDLKDALTKAGALEAFEKSAPSMRKEYVRQVEEAKAQETRERRISKIVEKLSGK